MRSGPFSERQYGPRHNLRLEAGCPTLANRITARLCNIAARALVSSFSSTLRETLARPVANQGPHYYANKVATHIRRANLVQVATKILPDTPPPQVRQRPPWADLRITTTAVALPKPKHICSHEQIQHKPLLTHGI